MVASVEMAGNATFPVRHATLVRVCAAPLTAVLEIREERPRTKSAVASRYAVREVPGGPGRRFKLTKSGGAAWYFVCLAAGGGWDECECRAHAAGRPCKHLQALRALEAAGHLEKS